MVDQIIRRQVLITLFRLHHRTNPNMFRINNIVKLTLILLDILHKTCLLDNKLVIINMYQFGQSTLFIQFI